MNSDVSPLQAARQDAELLARLKKAARELPELERQARLAAVAAEAGEKAEALEARFDGQVDGFKAALEASNAEVEDLKFRIQAVVRNRLRVFARYEEMHKTARSLAGQKWRADNPEGFDSLDALQVKSDVQAAAEQHLLDEGIDPLCPLVVGPSPADAALYDIMVVFNAVTNSGFESRARRRTYTVVNHWGESTPTY